VPPDFGVPALVVEVVAEVVVDEVHAVRPVKQIKINARITPNNCFFTILSSFLYLKNQIEVNTSKPHAAQAEAACLLFKTYYSTIFSKHQSFINIITIMPYQAFPVHSVRLKSNSIPWFQFNTITFVNRKSRLLFLNLMVGAGRFELPTF
jgi:hypothetical protein